MTSLERIDYVNAIYQLRLGPDLIADIADYHRDFFNLDDVGDGSSLDIHMNLPDEPEKEIFLAWHRSQMLELEHGIQAINSYLSIPYVDWDLDNSINSPIWDEDFMGQFNEDWNLNRALGAAGQLPTQNDYDNLINSSDVFFEFSNTFERGVVHAGPHNWVGGLMRGGSSPRDPVFYLHHANVDRIWHLYESEHSNSAFLRTSMLRYDGTYLFDGELLPLVNPNELVNSNAIGVFYAQDQQADLEEYVVSNRDLAVEHFYYQFLIEIKNGFSVPNNNSCLVESRQVIIIKPGFHAHNGSDFQARIDDSDLSKLDDKLTVINRNQIPFDQRPEDYINMYSINVYEESFDLERIPSAYPNPFETEMQIGNLEISSRYRVQITDLLGNLLIDELMDTNSAGLIELNNLDHISAGAYILILSGEGQRVMTFKVLKK